MAAGLLLAEFQADCNRNFSPGSHVSLYHFWSLAVEEQFYLVWPAVVFLVRTKEGLLRTTLIASVGALVLRLVLAGYGVSPLTIHVTTICRADSLLLGGALALVYRSARWAEVDRLAPWGFCAAITLLLVAITFVEPLLQHNPRGYMMWSEGLEYTVLAVASASLIAWSLRVGSMCGRLFEMGPMRFLGKYSYGIYVLHVLVISAMNLPLRAELLEVTHSKMTAVMGAGLASLAVSIVAAYGSYHLYEKRFLKLKHRFDYSRRALNHGSPEDAYVEPQVVQS